MVQPIQGVNRAVEGGELQLVELGRRLSTARNRGTHGIVIHLDAGGGRARQGRSAPMGSAAVEEGAVNAAVERVSGVGAGGGRRGLRRHRGDYGVRGRCSRQGPPRPCWKRGRGRRPAHLMERDTGRRRGSRPRDRGRRDRRSRRRQGRLLRGPRVLEGSDVAIGLREHAVSVGGAPDEISDAAAECRNHRGQGVQGDGGARRCRG
jgi:hypothetical protein